MKRRHSYTLLKTFFHPSKYLKIPSLSYFWSTPWNQHGEMYDLMLLNSSWPSILPMTLTLSKASSLSMKISFQKPSSFATTPKWTSQKQALSCFSSYSTSVWTNSTLVILSFPNPSSKLITLNWCSWIKSTSSSKKESKSSKKHSSFEAPNKTSFTVS